MKTDTYVAALEIGSSKITGAVGRLTPDDKLQVVAVEQEPSLDSVRYGIIQNPEEVASRVIRIIDRLNNNPAVIPMEIKGLFVGISGRSMRSIPSEVKVEYPEELEVTEEVLEKLRQDATLIEMDSNLEIFKIIPRSYQIDGLETSSPKGAMGKTIKATFDIIVGRTELRRNILRALPERTGLHVRSLVPTTMAAADIVLTDDEKGLGCMLVDFGAETTTVAIYRKGALCYYATLPLGGRNITRDLTSLSILEERAEELKIESGRAVPRETPSTLNVSGIKLSDVSNIVVARAEEIVANVIQQIYYAGLKESDLPAGIVCIGAGSNLNGILTLMQNQSGLNARQGHLPGFIETVEPRAKRMETLETAALLFAGSRTSDPDCLELPEPEDDEEEDPKPDPDPEPDGGKKMSGFFNKIGDKIGRFFAPPSEQDSELD